MKKIMLLFIINCLFIPFVKAVNDTIKGNRINTITVKPGATGELNIAPYLNVLYVHRDLTFEQVLSGNCDSLFSKNTPGNSRQGIDAWCWARIRIKSDANNITSWVIQTEKLYSEVSCYIIYPDGQTTIQKSGWSLPPVNRSVVDPDVIFHLSLNPYQSAVIYLHIHTLLRWSSIDTVKAKLTSSDEWNNLARKKYAFLLFYAGGCFLAVLYWLTSYLYSFRANYLFYIASTLSTILVYMDHFGIVTFLFWGASPWYFLSKYGFVFLWMPFIMIVNYALAARLNKFKKNLPRLIYLYWLLAIFTALFYILGTFFLSWKYFHNISVMLNFSLLFLSPCFMVYLWLRTGSKTSGFAFIAYFSWIIGFYCFFLSSIEVIPDRLVFNLIGPAGALVTVILLFYDVVNYVRALRKKREKETREKEQLIHEQELKSISAMLEGQETERKRIASDLHDRLGSMLSTVKLYFGLIEEQIDMQEEKNKEQYNKANFLLDEACEEVRKISHNLVSGELASFGLVSALTQMKSTIEDSGLIKINFFSFGMDARLGSAVEIALYTVVQELVNNILKHSKATEVTIQLNKVDNNLNIVVEDNGVGFDVVSARSKDGMGLKNQEIRIDKLNGSISIDSAKGKGTTTIIDIPV